MTFAIHRCVHSRRPQSFTAFVAGSSAQILFALLLLPAMVTPAQESYPVHPDTVAKDGVPRGVVTAHRFTNSTIYPGTERDYFVYVPAQYDQSSPAALMVFQDGAKYVRENGEYRIHHVFDNLIHRGEMPVTIAVCINPGVVPGGEGAQDRFNRSFEYDTVSDRYASFLIDELLPEVRKSYAITEDPNLRAIGGSSSGAIAAFGVAWHRSDQFRRVFSTVGTYVGLRGGNEYPVLVRKHEPKPLRVFLQDGSNDLNIYGGSWWNANQTMLSSLQWAGYQVKNVWGEGGHNGKHGAAIFPDAMKWLWTNFDQPIETNVSEHPEIKDRLIEGESWKLVSEGHKYTEGPAVAPNGDVYFIDGPRGEIWKIAAGTDKATKFTDDMSGVSALMFDAAGRLYCARNKALTVTRIDPDGSRTDLCSGVSCNDLVVLEHGIYFTGPTEQVVWYLPIDADGNPRGDGKPIQAGKGPKKPNGLIVTPDRRFLMVVDAEGRYVWSYKINSATGELLFGQPYSYVHTPQDDMTGGADGVTMTKDGSLLVATKLGIQIIDPPGRVHLILSRPSLSGKLSNCVLAGKNMSTLYVTCGSKVFSRETKLDGIAPWQSAVQPPKPRL
ncbi:gluconolactonase [Rhodopirellula baltica SH28]|uniref:Gluconolactonase n=1 Tax=Rhodopirellula baltica SH28 TaxID=993517 RepID=K5DD66_RHOBT|nr:SMP-30/gluconolactonase/LRE family protein [Rhodopirellula baltica]EKK00388.1 gluconolactonase [Rhodopirellula baltica SH28]